MKVVGIVVEYNPLHNGHAYHFQMAKEVTGADACVAVMSGNFLQRGEPALVNKWARTEMALRLGIDLVLELPVAYATQNAETFAFGAVSALHRLGSVDFLCFGSESGDIARLQQLARLVWRCEHEETSAFRRRLQSRLKQGESFPKAFARAAQSLADGKWALAFDLQQPNNILGIHYLLALQRLRSPIVPYTIRRRKAGYHQQEITDESIASATAIRKQLLSAGNLEGIKRFVPASTYEILHREFQAGRGPVSWESFLPLLRHRLITSPPQELAGAFDLREGLENRIKKQMPYAASVSDLVARIKTKRYTWNRIQRALLNIMLGLSKEKMQQLQAAEGVPYLRVLGFNRVGQRLLNEAKKKSLVPIITRIPRERHPALELDVQASMVYALAYEAKQANEQLRREFAQPPLRLDGE
ncbi:nucleotidyltransferase [Bacillaceae bacterium]